MKTSLSLRDALLALSIMAVWGTNFVVARIALDVLPPLLFAALRFTFVLLPLIFLFPRPRSVRVSGSDQNESVRVSGSDQNESVRASGSDQNESVRASGSDPQRKVSWRNLAAYGLCIGMGQFGLLFIAMDGLISPGLASLVIQMQVFFTVALSMVRSAERLRPHQLAAFGLAIAGMFVILAHNGQGATAAGVAITLGAAASWAFGNQAARESGAANILAYVVWASLFSAPPLFVLALLLEGWPAIRHGLQHAGPAIWAAVLWQSVGNTMFGYGFWAWLLSRYPAATIAPMSLLVPVFGFAASSLWLGEPIQAWKIAAALLVMAGLALNLLWRPRAAATRQSGSRKSVQRFSVRNRDKTKR